MLLGENVICKVSVNKPYVYFQSKHDSGNKQLLFIGTCILYRTNRYVDIKENNLILINDQ